ncbi:MAG: serine hydrolase domain-containing protein [Bacteroidota bacterium]
MKYTFWLLFCGLSLLFACGAGRPIGTDLKGNNPPALEKKIDKLYKNLAKNGPGYMVGIFKDGDYLFQKGYGMANVEYQMPINQQSMFNLASLSKQFTAAAIAILLKENRISLEDDIRTYVPSFPDYPTKVQLKHLIYMTSGINDYTYTERKNGTDWSSMHYFNIDTAITAALDQEALMYTPGTQWSYSNINFMLLTKVVEAVSKMPFADFVEQHLFQPTGMNTALVNDDRFQVIPNRVDGYNFRDKENTDLLIELGYLPEKGEGLLKIDRNSPHYGGSGVYASMDDLQRWFRNFETMDFGGQEFYDLMHQKMKFDHEKTNDLFGLYEGDFNGQTIIAYEGGDWGFSSHFMRFPDYGITICVLSNLGSGNTRSYTNRITDILVNEGILTFN